MPSSVALPTSISGGATLPTCTPDNVVLSSDTTTIHHATSSHILLSTALVKVVSEGKRFDARILLDNGSTANFITSSFCDRLRLPRRSASSTVTVKAVHIELVTDLTKEAYLAALNRFVARRGKPRSILSDNGTNFVGASNDLHNFLLESDLAYDVNQQGIEFTFSPPYTPHFNGIAEAAVRSTKHHLKRLLQLTHFTFEEMATCLTQIEAVLNSRPLTPISSDPLDFSALTPSHFLIGRPLMSVPHPQVTDTNVTRLERYQRVQHVKQHFWNRFYLEYVSLLQLKTKWTTSTGQPLAVGTLVLVKEKGQPPLLWPLGRITQVFPGSDGTTRVAELKTKRGTILRAFNNLCPLPLA
ncbi:uncharacterized protein LOC114350305 isoform X6 [Ostrinia furnacalis]|uniref:uncharacterized protein LOC114350305 isoform X6 n=1 Tax=Ostrinia furnacalis TaxID=93504 RepID=UPI00103FA899|nr:uncharacterized protein LOC114350305 isoform X6 [Ostrinia furnacalis]